MKTSPPVCTRFSLWLCTLLICMHTGNALSAGEKETMQPETLKEKGTYREKGVTAAAPLMVIRNREFDVGEVYEGTPVSHAFVVQNRGEGDLLINAVKPG